MITSKVHVYNASEATNPGHAGTTTQQSADKHIGTKSSQFYAPVPDNTANCLQRPEACLAQTAVA